MLNIMQDPPSVMTRSGISVDPLLEAFAKKLMARELSDRFVSAQQALEVLDMIETHRAMAARILGVDTSVPEPIADDAAITRRHRLAIGTVGTVGTVGAESERLAHGTQGEEVAVVEQPPRQRQRGMTFGAAAVMVAAFVGAFLLGVCVG